VLERIRDMRGGEVFVPKMATARMTDFAAAIAPGCAVEEIGIRPGEKLHEVLITEDEARHAFECGGYFVVEPEFDWFSRAPGHARAPLPEDFCYSSDTAGLASVPEIRALIERVLGEEQRALAAALVQ
jgi:UDP-N-acetylglucosamine 4,6-dehydratase